MLQKCMAFHSLDSLTEAGATPGTQSLDQSIQEQKKRRRRRRNNESQSSSSASCTASSGTDFAGSAVFDLRSVLITLEDSSLKMFERHKQQQLAIRRPFDVQRATDDLASHARWTSVHSKMHIDY